MLFLCSFTQHAHLFVQQCPGRNDSIYLAMSCSIAEYWRSVTALLPRFTGKPRPSAEFDRLQNPETWWFSPACKLRAFRVALIQLAITALRSVVPAFKGIQKWTWPLCMRAGCLIGLKCTSYSLSTVYKVRPLWHQSFCHRWPGKLSHLVRYYYYKSLVIIGINGRACVWPVLVVSTVSHSQVAAVD